ncbi:MAG TPA: HlyD family efflux transporter periplasmic adaptor subunit [Roseiflexaceae bacterium]|nr:HlyD family efflux transporter periplasmic adaptor subunit [Roseiflexaceae bacterium]HMP41122.1 HlyD family efflux transporter periplasmic adaptor subunit [Roseiflexaceae bacterium]
MKQRILILGVIGSAAALVMAACAGQPQATPTSIPAPAPTVIVQPTTIAVSSVNSIPLALGVTGAGEIAAVRDADLSFQVTGTVAQVFIEEGAQVKAGDLLAILDVRPFDQQLAQAEAALASAKAQEAALSEDPRDADLVAARAQVRQAEAALIQLRAGAKAQDLDTARAAVQLAEVNLQSTRDRLSFAKTQAEFQVEQAAAALTQAQSRYAQTKYNWEYARDTGNDPIVPKTRTATGAEIANKLSDGQRENYYAQFVQAEAALRQAEKSVELAVKAAESARQAEITGIAAAEAQLMQSQKAFEKLQLPPDQDRLAAAQAGVAQARAAEARLLPDPRDSQIAAAAAGVAQAEASLTLAQINRERAELRAPFDGVIAVVNIDPGDSSVVQGRPAIQVVDISELRVEVQISDVDIVRVQLGQPASVRIDGMNDTVYNGTVSFIAPTATSSGAVRTYQVYIALESQTGLRAGMNARVEIRV